MFVQAIDEEARRGVEEFEKEIKDTAAAMRKQLMTKVSQSCCLCVWHVSWAETAFVMKAWPGCHLPAAEASCCR